MRALVGVAALALAAYLAYTLVGGPSTGLDWLFDDVVYVGIMVVAAGACLLRALLIPTERVAWAAMGVGLALWTTGDVIWTALAADGSEPPSPTLADAFYLAFYPACYLTLVLLVRSRLRAQSSLWIDGSIAALAVAALAAALAYEPIADAVGGSTGQVAVSLAYPLADLLLLGLVIAVLGGSGWRPGRAWALIVCGLALNAIADGVYLVELARGTYMDGSPLDALWLAAALLVACAAWQPAKSHAIPDTSRLRVGAAPVVSVMFAIGLLVVDHFARLNLATLILATSTVLLGVAKLGLVLRDNRRILARSELDASTDALTGLRNRRSLMKDLVRDLSEATTSDPRALLLFDLDGFKEYNDAFGHPAGDGLLARLGARLADVVRDRGTAYRLGGDEFCAFVKPGVAGLDPLVAACVEALTERGDGFEVGVSYGVAQIPGEVQEMADALQLADRRMYASKGGRRVTSGRQARDAVLRTLADRQPLLEQYLRDVAEMALLVGRQLGMSAEDLDEVARAAELHDIGKIAIPEAILSKAGPLDQSEWDFMRRHTIVGERILLTAPALRPVARLVRSSHEHWDGEGYPDGLVGEEIPLGARVVAVCDAFDAITSDRPYRPGVPPTEALAELRRCAGTQFDPAVVEALAAVLTQTGAERPKATP